jgi:hypothetical protein
LLYFLVNSFLVNVNFRCSINSVIFFLQIFPAKTKEATMTNANSLSLGKNAQIPASWPTILSCTLGFPKWSSDSAGPSLPHSILFPYSATAIRHPSSPPSPNSKGHRFGAAAGFRLSLLTLSLPVPKREKSLRALLLCCCCFVVHSTSQSGSGPSPKHNRKRKRPAATSAKCCVKAAGVELIIVATTLAQTT